jgi:two-component system CheB/CheR fusion protein
MWGLRQDEATSEHLLALDIGLPTDQLRPALKAVFGGEHTQAVVLDAVNRRGRRIQVRVTATALRAGDDGPTGAVLVMQQQANGSVDGNSRPA